jgi:signal transduction histidine kinase
VTNAFRHSRATEITVELKALPKSIVLVVTDNGCGFDAARRNDAPSDEHWGIHGMRERAQSIDASFECRSNVGTGTMIIVTVPLRRAYAKGSQIEL